MADRKKKRPESKQRVLKSFSFRDVTTLTALLSRGRCKSHMIFANCVVAVSKTGSYRTSSSWPRTRFVAENDVLLRSQPVVPCLGYAVLMFEPRAL